MLLLSVNQRTTALAKNNKFYARSKHIDIRYHFIREAMSDNNISLTFVPTDENVNDIFTKPLASPKFQFFVSKLRLRTA
jgi:hypothetical protein